MNFKKMSKLLNLVEQEENVSNEVLALSKHLEVPTSNIEESDEYDYGLPTFEVKMNDNKICIYSISSDEYDIKRAVEDSLENLYDDMGISEFMDKVVPYLGNASDFLSGDVEDYYIEFYYDYAQDIATEEGTRFIEEMEELGLNPEDYDHNEDYTEWESSVFDAFAQASYERLDDPLEEFIAEWRHDPRMIEHYLTLDFSYLADECINSYGAGHELARYDGHTEEVELDGVTYFIFKQDERDYEED